MFPARMITAILLQILQLLGYHEVYFLDPGLVIVTVFVSVVSYILDLQILFHFLFQVLFELFFLLLRDVRGDSLNVPSCFLLILLYYKICILNNANFGVLRVYNFVHQIVYKLYIV